MKYLVFTWICWVAAGCFPVSAELPQTEDAVSLEVCRAYALANAPGLERQRLSYSNRVESVVIAKAKYDPVLTVRRGWQDEDDPGRTTGNVSQTLPADLRADFSARYEERDGEALTDYSLQLSKTILGGGSLLESRLPVRRAEIQEAIEANTLSQEQRRRMLTVTRNYFAVVRNILTLQLRKLQLERARTNLEHAIIKEDPLDIATAELRVPETEQEVLDAGRSIDSSLLVLKENIGMPVETPLNVQTQLVFEVRPIQMEQDRERAMSQHEDILNARLQAVLARKELEVANSKRMPEVRLSATAERQDPDNGEGTDLRGELVVEWPWLDRVDRARARQRALEVRQQEIQLFETRQKVWRRITEVALEVEEAERSVDLQIKRLAVLERQFELYKDRWENGEINILEYIRSQNDLENARVRLITERTRYLEARAEYDFVKGP